MKATIWQDFKSREGAHEKKNVFFLPSLWMFGLESIHEPNSVCETSKPLSCPHL